MEQFLGYDWERDIFTVILVDQEKMPAVGIFQNEVGSLLYKAGILRNFPLPILITQGKVIRGDQTIIDVKTVVLDPSFLIPVSMLNSWTYCGAVYVQVYLGLSNPLTPALLKGSIAHDFLAGIFAPEVMQNLQKGQNWDPILKTDLQRAIFDNWVSAVTLCWDEDQLQREFSTEFLPIQADFLREYLQISPAMPQIQTEFPVASRSFGLYGRIDRLERKFGNPSAIIETKTGRATPRTIQAARNQALAYHIALNAGNAVNNCRLLIEFPWQPSESRFIEKEKTDTDIENVISMRNSIYAAFHGVAPPLLRRDSLSALSHGRCL